MVAVAVGMQRTYRRWAGGRPSGHPLPFASVPTLRLSIERVVAGGAGLAREPSGRVVFVDGALPGETVDAELFEEQRDFARARVVDVVDASPDRVAPPCLFVAAGCGGCGWQHVDHPAQLRLKEDIVADALRRVARLPELPPISTSHPFAGGRRTTVRAAVLGDRLGFHRQASADIVAIDACMVAHPRVSAVLAEGRFPGATEVVVRTSVATGETLVLVDPPEAAARAVVPDAVTVGGGKDRLLLDEDVAGHRLRVSARSFFQSSPDVATALVEAVGAVAGDLDGAQVLDAYGGVGVFARCLAIPAGAASSTVIEDSRSAAADARENLRGHAGRVIRCEVARWRPSPADVVIADPARPGLGKPGVRALVAAEPSRLVLVSCDAGSLGRDIGLLRGAGYRAERVTLVDAFPHTPHVEAVTLLGHDAP